MTSLKYSVASLAMLLVSGLAYAEDATTTITKPAVENKIDCPAAGTVAEADLPADCKNQAASEMPKQDNASATATTMAPANTVLASEFMGQSVYSTGNERVGEINDLVMDKDLDGFVAIIGVGGFLGIGEKDVAVPVGDIQTSKDENNNLRLTIAATKEQLEAAPAFDRAARSSTSSSTGTTVTDPATTTAATELPKQDAAATSATATDTAATTEKPAQDTTSTSTSAAVTDPAVTTTAATELPKQDSTASSATAETDPAASTTATTEMPKQDATTTTTAEAQTDPAAATEVPKDSATVSETTTAATELPKQDSATVTTAAEDTTTAATAGVNPSTAVLASQFMGQTVYSTGNENVGEINDLVMSKELENVVAIIGVGGFLGIGEKDVAIPVTDLTASKDENNNLRLTIAASKEQLEAAPVFDRTALK